MLVYQAGYQEKLDRWIIQADTQISRRISQVPGRFKVSGATNTPSLQYAQDITIEHIYI